MIILYTALNIGVRTPERHNLRGEIRAVLSWEKQNPLWPSKRKKKLKKKKTIITIIYYTYMANVWIVLHAMKSIRCPKNTHSQTFGIIRKRGARCSTVVILFCLLDLYSLVGTLTKRSYAFYVKSKETFVWSARGMQFLLSELPFGCIFFFLNLFFCFPPSPPPVLFTAIVIVLFAVSRAPRVFPFRTRPRKNICRA